MAGPSIAVRVLGDLSGLGKSLGDAGTKAAGVASQGTAAFKTFLGSVNATGALGPLGGMLDQIASGIQNLADGGKKVGPVMAGAGVAVTGLGAGLSAFGSKEQAAQQQLSQAIANTGHSYDDYGDAIEGAIKHGENYGHTSEDTQKALQRLTEATHDPAKALELLSTAEDVSASKHEDLGTAAGQVGKVFNGNKKLLKDFGIQLDANTGLTKDGKTATEALAEVTRGQAAAAQDTFAGKLDAVKAKLTDSVAQLGQKYGPALQGIGVAVTLLGTIWSTVGPIIAAMELATMGPILLIVGAVVALVAIGYVLWRNWDTIWGGIKAAIGAVWDWISTYWPLLLGILLGPIALAVALIYMYWDQVKAGVAAVIDFIQYVWNGLVGFFAGLPGRVAGFFAAIWDGIKNGASSAIDWVRTQLDNLVSWVSGIPGRIGSAAAGAFDGLSGAFKEAYNFIARTWNGLEFSLPSVDTHIPGVGKIGGWSIGTEPKLPILASGGLITSSGLVYAHAGEAITPYPPSPAVHVENAHFGDAVDVDLFMQRVAWSMERQRV